MDELKFFIGTFIQMFALLSPFGSAVFFLANTTNLEPAARKQTAMLAMLAITIATFLVFLVGNLFLELFGITLDAFRIGTGTILMLNSISIVRGTKFYEVDVNAPSDFAFVPFAVPFVVGPGIVGYLIVLSVQTTDVSKSVAVIVSLTMVITIMTILLLHSDKFQRIIGRRVMAVIDRLFGLLYCSMAAQIIFEGARNYFK